MIIFDDIGHMVSTESSEELHLFARKLGLKSKWYQNPSRGSKKQQQAHSEYLCHYDLTTQSSMNRAEALGALRVNHRDIIERAWWHK